MPRTVLSSIKLRSWFHSEFLVNLKFIGIMSFLSSSSSLKHLAICLDMNSREAKPGDLIEISRVSPFPYQHWALCISKSLVIHLQAPASGSGSSAAATKGVMGIVSIEKLSDVVGKDKWRINNCLDEKYKVRPIPDILAEASSLDGASLPYHVLDSNCEHFVTELRYGKAESRQVQDVVEGVGILGGVAVALALAGAGVMKN